jgi:hypothetical protein
MSTDFGYDEALGFVPATFDGLFAAWQTAYTAATEENVDVESGPAADQGRTVSVLLKAAYDDQLGVYNAGWVDGAPGTGGVAGGSSLELLLTPKIGPKLLAEASTITITMGAAAGPAVNVPAGSKIVIAGETLTWSLDSPVVIPGGGFIDGEFTYSETGPKTAVVSSTWSITTPVSGWVTNTNSAAAVVGRDIETDDEYRARFRSSTSDNVVAAVLKVPGVTAATMIEWPYDSADAFWGLKRWIEIIAVGGDDVAIATAIQGARAKSVTTVGNVSIALSDPSYVGGAVVNKFSRPVPVTVHVEVTITKGEGYPADASEDAAKARTILIREAIVAAGALLVAGQDVVSYQLATVVGSAGIPGIANAVVLVGFADPPLLDGVLVIPDREQATISSSDVDVFGA